MLRHTPSRARITVAAFVAGLAGVSAGSSPAALPLFAAASSAGTSSPAATLTIATPAGAGAGHVLVAAVAVRADAPIAAPSGWAEAVRTTCSGNNGVLLTQAIFVRAASAAEPGSHTFAVGAATGAVGAIVAYTGVDREQPVLASGGQTRRNSKLMTAPSVATSVAGALLVGAFTHSGRTAIAPPNGMTAHAAAATGTGSPDARLLAADEPRPAPGASGERTASADQWNVCSVGQLVALRPAPDPPASSAAPAVAGVAQEGHVLTATTGSWSSQPTSFAYRWQRGSGQNWVDVAGATATGYPLTAADVGSRLRVVVTATNSGGAGTAASDPTAVILPAAPTNTSPPAIAGTAREHETLTGDAGTWSGAPATFSFEWQRSTGGATWVSVPGATSSVYALTAADVGAAVRVVVTASNAGGSGTAASAETAPVEPAAPPGAIQPPTISGWQQEGEPVAATTGTWSGSPAEYAFRWQRSADGESWLDVEGAEAAIYTLAAADVGSTIRVVVTATNAAGSTSAASEQIGPIGPGVPPSNLESPAILGVPRQGEPVQATTGTWAGAPRTYAYQWQRSADGGATWADIQAATTETYTPAAGDVGLRLGVTVTASNANGSESASSAASEPVLPLPPTISSPPAVSGDAVEGATLLASTGEWLGDPTDFAYEWQRCNADGCTAIRFANDADYTLRDDDVGFTILVVVTASSASGSTPSSSAPTDVVLPLPPVNEEPPAIAGVPAQGETLTASTGDWQSSAPVAFAYRWQRSGDGGATWADVPGADAGSYLLGAGDVGSSLRVSVTATNAGGSAAASSAATAAVSLPGAPTSVVGPTISGVVQERGRLNAIAGTWSGSPAFAYAWQRSSDDGATWNSIARATNSRYTAAAADVGNHLRVVVTATNGLGSAVAASSAWEIFPTGNRFYLVNSTWYCNTAVDLDLVKVTIADGGNRDGIRFDNCSGRIGRVEIDTNGIDGLKVRNTGEVAHDLTVEGGYVRCTGNPEESHPDGIQVLAGSRVTFRNLVVWCGSPDPDFGAGVNSSALIAKGGGGTETPTDVVIEHSVMGPGTANGVLVEESVRSGIRGSVACPDWTAAGGPVLVGVSAVDGIDVDNEKPGLEDPRCSSFEAALAWAAQP